MPPPQRFIGPLLSTATPKTAFDGQNAKARMDIVRQSLRELRESWSDNDRYDRLLADVRSFVNETEPPESVRGLLEEILHGYHDYADTNYNRPNIRQPERYACLQLYCTQDGYEYLFRVHSQTLREPEPDMHLVLVAAIFLEFLTIDLYNLRLSNIGDEMFSNFQGVTYRGLKVRAEDIERYRGIATRPKLEDRSFSIPLGLMSSTTDQSIMRSFARQLSSKEYALHMTIHVHGLDQDLLNVYLERYPDSVVTTICAMPVARLSPFGEKEILLRGAFFHVVDWRQEHVNGRDVHYLAVVMMSANRDHTTELSSNEGAKMVQREIFTEIVKASRFEVCAKLAAEIYSHEDDSTQFSLLQQEELEKLRERRLSVSVNGDLANERSSTKATWLGGSLMTTYPQSYCQDRHDFRDAILSSRWADAMSILDREYAWRLNDWLSIRDLKDAQGQTQDDKPGYTTLHILASSPSVSNMSEADTAAWSRLVTLLQARDVWKSLRTLDTAHSTAYQLALEHDRLDLVEVLRPRIVHTLESSVLSSLEGQLHELMRSKAANLIDAHAFDMPSLSVIVEMQRPELWIPIPHMHGGFNVLLKGQELEVTVYETIPPKTQPQITIVLLHPHVSEGASR